MQLNKRYLMALVAVMGFSYFASGLAEESVARDQALSTLEKAFLEQQLLSTDGGIIRSVIEPLKLKNRALTEEQWAQIAQELQTKLMNQWLDPTHSFHRGFKQAMGGLTDDDLVRMSQMLSEPAWKKYQQALTQPTLGKAISIQMTSSMDDVNNTITDIVREHHLRLP